MNKILIVLLFLFPGFLFAQPVALSKAIAPQPFLPASSILPVPDSKINYTIVMFDHPPVEKAIYYVLTVSLAGEKDTVPVFTVRDSTTATLLQGFEFGKKYSWNYAAYGKKQKLLSRSKNYSFSILPLPEDIRVRLNKNEASKNQGGFISFDYAQVITDRNGNPVWFLPPAKGGEFKKDNLVRDLRVSPAGTFTFMTERNIFETSVDGRIIWKGPVTRPGSKDNIENFHHSFERMPNGNLLTMGTHTVVKQLPGDTAHVKVDYGVIAEYSHNNRLLWRWDSENYFKDEDILSRKTSTGEPNPSVHMNACIVTDSGYFAYAGFRDMNRIVKIDRFTGNVVASYGTHGPSGEARTADGFFRRQHDVCLLRDGSLAVFNNDSVADPSAVSSVVIFSQPQKAGEESKLLWSFSCKFDSLTDGRSERAGSIEELPNGNYLVNMGSLNRCIEVSPSKEVVWDVFVESWSKEKNQWIAFNQYRSHYIPSLYPCYFTVAAVGKIGSKVTVDIFNEGTEADSYYVEYKAPDGAWIIDQETKIIPAGGKATVTVLRPGPTGIVFNEMRIRSKMNQDFSRPVPLK